MKALSALGVLATLASTISFAQTAATSTVPVPEQLASAHTIFLASAGAAAVQGHDAEAAGMLYSSAYRALSSSGRYHLTLRPADADLSMTISIESSYTDVTHGQSYEMAFVRLSIFDTKTHSLLWNIDEPVESAFRKASFQKNIDETIAKVVGDLNSLATGKLP